MYFCDMKQFFLVVLMLAMHVMASSQISTIDCRLASSYINQNMKEWGGFVDELTVEIDKNHSLALQFERAVVRHMYLAYLLFNDKNSKQIDVQLEGLKKDIEALEKTEQYKKQVLALKSPYLAYSALNNPVTALYRLPMSFSAAKTAISENPKSEYSWAEYGNLQYCYALFIGGNFSDAVSSFKKAIAIIEGKGENKACNWYYINSLLFLAKCYEDGKNYADANRVYDRLLQLRPDYEAVKRWKHK